MTKDSKRVKMTLLLDSDTIKALNEYSFIKFGKTNVSNAVRELAKEYGKTKEKKEHSS